MLPLVLAASPEPSCLLADARSPDSRRLVVPMPLRLLLAAVGVLLLLLLVLATPPEPSCLLAGTRSPDSCRVVASVARCLLLLEVGVLDLLVLATPVESKCLL